MADGHRHVATLLWLVLASHSHLAELTLATWLWWPTGAKGSLSHKVSPESREHSVLTTGT